MTLLDAVKTLLRHHEEIVITEPLANNLQAVQEIGLAMRTIRDFVTLEDLIDRYSDSKDEDV